MFGGTSISSPLVASIFALTGKGSVGNGFPYANKSAFFDVTTGSNGSCGGTYLCTGKVGYDGPTGLGTPNGQAVASGGGGGTDAGTDSGGGGTDAGTDSGGGGTDAGTDSGGGGNTCSHPICSAGPKLAKACDPCVAKICAADSFCCRNKWDSVCVGEVASVCGETCH